MQNFLRGVFRDAVYPKDIWHGDAIYPRIFCRGVPKIGGVKYPMTPGLGRKRDDLVFLEDNQQRKNYDDAFGGLLPKGRRYIAQN